MKKYPFERTTLQFSKNFVKFLDEKRGKKPKNRFIEECCGYIDKKEIEDGYISWSPKEPLENAYRLDSNLSFGHAIELMKKGCKLAREVWNGKGIYVALQMPDENSKMTFPYLYMNTTKLQTDNKKAQKNLVPWIASQTDMLSNDWALVNKEWLIVK